MLKESLLLELFKELETNQILSKSLKENQIFDLSLINLGNKEQYFGFMKEGQPDGLGIIYDKLKTKKLGVFKKGFLHGLGKLQEEEYFLDGEWRNGEFTKGIYYEEKTDKYFFGSFYKNKCCNAEYLGDGVPIDLISNILI